MSEFTSFFRQIRPPRPSGWRIRAEVGRLVEGVRATLNIGHRLERARKVARGSRRCFMMRPMRRHPIRTRHAFARPILRLASARAQ